jgi:hypothetical protein
VTKLITIYDGFLTRRRVSDDTERARQMTTEELHAAMLQCLPTEVLVAEVARRPAVAPEPTKKAPVSQEVEPEARRAEPDPEPSAPAARPAGAWRP